MIELSKQGLSASRQSSRLPLLRLLQPIPKNINKIHYVKAGTASALAQLRTRLIFCLTMRETSHGFANHRILCQLLGLPAGLS
jgi:hypothetical protein